ncbi:MAG TPA: PhoU domain-containing protein [Acidimicrobiales bacterium]|nr:PhoU domain-containing protein [Acidimicrobiales bacterium]
MRPSAPTADIDQQVAVLFALVTEALAKATDALLTGDPMAGQDVVDRDVAIDRLTREVGELVWDQIDSHAAQGDYLRHLVGVLLMLPELERSADLAEHIAQRAVENLGVEMSPFSRGIIQRMTEVALGMWQTAGEAYAERTAQGVALSEDDEEIDILHERLTREVATGAMPAAVAAQVTLLARFYERLGDHAVNLARRVGTFGTGGR